MPDESSLHPPNEELEQRAKLFAERARQLLEELHEDEVHATAGGNITFKSMAALHNFLQSQSCYAELNRRRAIERADRDKQEAENRGNRDRDRENRHFWLEIGLTIVIIALIGWEIHEGRQQAALLHEMNKNTADTALQIQRAADATTASFRNPPTGTHRTRKKTETRTLRWEPPHRQSNRPSHDPQWPYPIHCSP